MKRKIYTVSPICKKLGIRRKRIKKYLADLIYLYDCKFCGNSYSFNVTKEVYDEA